MDSGPLRANTVLCHSTQYSLLIADVRTRCNNVGRFKTDKTGYANQRRGLKLILSTPRGIHYGPLCENMTSSTKPEVHNVLHWCQKRTDPRPRVTSTENFVKFGHATLGIYEWTDTQTDKQTYGYRHTDTLIATLRTLLGRCNHCEYDLWSLHTVHVRAVFTGRQDGREHECYFGHPY